MNRRKRCHELFRFREDIRSESSKITCQRSQRLRHANFSIDTDIFIFLNYCYWVCKHTQVPLFTWLFLQNLWVALKNFRKCSRILVSVCIVVNYIRGHTLSENIFAKMKKFAKPFLSVHMGPRSNLLSKKSQKISWHCPFKVNFRGISVNLRSSQVDCKNCFSMAILHRKD